MVPRARWCLPAAATCLVLGAVLSVVLTLSISGQLGAPERAVTRVETGDNDVAAMQSARLDASEPGNGGTPATVGLSTSDRVFSEAIAADPAPGGIPATDGAAGVEGTQTRSPKPTADVVHVAGAVRNPGIVTLPGGSRVHEAITAAGGAAPDAQLSVVNLAAILQDGQQLYVPTSEEVERGNYTAVTDAAGPPAPGKPAPGQDIGAPAIVNVNSASVEQLSTLPGVGPVLSQRIVEWRNAHGAFRTVEELDAVAGIGPKMMQSLRDLVTF